MTDSDADVIEAIELTLLCRDLNCLPRAGGLKDQDARDVWIMKTVLNAVAERTERDRAKPKGGAQ